MKKKSFLELVDVCKTYGDHNVLKGIHLTIHQGEILSLLGINGAGKTTLSSIIATLHPCTSGSIIHEGKSIYSNITMYRSKIGYCAQKPTLDPALTLYQNLWFSGKLYGMSDSEIKNKIDYLDARLKLSFYFDKDCSILSGGYKQRFMIARSLMHNPSLLILDEPTVGLDPHIRRNLWDIMINLKNDGMTILLTTHYLDEAEKLSDRVCFLEQGEIKLIDTPKNLLQKYQKDTLEEMFISFLE